MKGTTIEAISDRAFQDLAYPRPIVPHMEHPWNPVSLPSSSSQFNYSLGNEEDGGNGRD